MSIHDIKNITFNKTRINTAMMNSTKNNNNNASSHYSSVHRMEEMKNSKKPKPVAMGEETDIDLLGIPPFILELQQCQPTLNIMTCGDVSHGKSTLLYALSGEKTGKDSREIRGNMTIKLGYTSIKIWKCKLCPSPQCYFSTHSNIEKTQCKYHSSNNESNPLLIRHISLIDVPGHAHLMQTMVSATSVSDGCILVIDSSKDCPGPQAHQHMSAIHLFGLISAKNQFIIAQNKIDLINQRKACQSYAQIREYLHSSFGGNDSLTHDTPIIPISAQSQLNIDALCHCIVNHLPKFSPKLLGQSVQTKNDLFVNIIRSFDVNKAKDLKTAKDIRSIKGGIIGGAVMNGFIKIGQMIEIRPGYIIAKKNNKNTNNQKWECRPIQTVVKSLKYGKRNALNECGFIGGNVGIQTNIDPSLTKSDRMCGQIICDSRMGNKPPIFDKFIMSFVLTQSNSKSKKGFKMNETIKVNIGSQKLSAEIVKCDRSSDNSDNSAVMCQLEHPICARVGDKVGICRQSQKTQEWSFVGGGIIRKTKNIQIKSENTETKTKTLIPIPIPNKTNETTEMSNPSKNQVHLRYQQRNARQGMTTIVGIANEVNFKKLITKMKRKWNCGATLITHTEKGPIIQLQGDLRREMPHFLVKLDIAKREHIVTHGY